MKTKSSKSKNKLVRIITMPLRALIKARDLYVRGMYSVERMSYPTAATASRSTGLPKSFSVAPARSNDNDDYAELIRAASTRDYGGRLDLDMLLQQQLREALGKTTTARTEVKGLPKSSSVGMGKIDEDEPYDFSDDKAMNKADAFYPRSKSYAVTKRSGVF